MSTYRVVRLHKDSDYRPVVLLGLTQEEAQEHCRNPETSSSTCTGAREKKHTKQWGAWFDAWEEERG